MNKPQRRPLFYVLLVAILAIWGTVFIQLMQGSRSGDMFVEFDPALHSERSAPRPLSTARIPFEATVKDPFVVPKRLLQRPRLKPVAVTKPIQESPKPPVPPPLALAGIVDDTAMLKGPNNLVVFARAGEAYFDMNITAIFPDSVHARFEGESITLVLP